MATQSPYLEVAYMSLRTSTPLFIKMEQDKTNKVNILYIYCEVINFVIQDVCP